MTSGSGLVQSWETETKVAAENVSVITNLLIAYGIIEEAFLLYAKKWIDEEAWGQWAAWLKDLAKHPPFDLIHQRMKGQFDKRFQDYVSKVLAEK